MYVQYYFPIFKIRNSHQNKFEYTQGYKKDNKFYPCSYHYPEKSTINSLEYFLHVFISSFCARAQTHLYTHLYITDICIKCKFFHFNELQTFFHGTNNSPTAWVFRVSRCTQTMIRSISFHQTFKAHLFLSCTSYIFVSHLKYSCEMKNYTF